MSIRIWLSRFQKPRGCAILGIYQLRFVAGMRQRVRFRIQYLLNASQWSIKVPRSVMLHPGKWVCSVTFSLGSFLSLLKIVESSLAGSAIYEVYSNNDSVILEGPMNMVVSSGARTRQCLNPTWFVQGHTYIQKRRTFRERMSGPNHAYPMGIWIWRPLKSLTPTKWLKLTGTEMNPTPCSKLRLSNQRALEYWEHQISTDIYVFFTQLLPSWTPGSKLLKQIAKYPASTESLSPSK